MPFRPFTHYLPRSTSCQMRLQQYSTQPRLSHLNEEGQASMVNIADKAPTKRTATAIGSIFIPAVAYNLITLTNSGEAGIPKSQEDEAVAKARRKGDVISVARLAAIMGCKRTSDLIPLCHPLAISNVDIALTPLPPPLERNGCQGDGRYSILCKATVTCEGKTGVEMEALTAVSIGLLTVWDMLKAVAGKDMEIGHIMVTDKTGGKSGDFHRHHN